MGTKLHLTFISRLDSRNGKSMEKLKLIYFSLKILRSIEFFESSLKLYRIQEFKMLQNFLDRSEQ